MRNTVFKTAALAGLFSCVLMLVGAFSGLTASVHATTASEVQTEADLEAFVGAAIDEYYINTIIKNCNFSLITVDFPTPGTPVSDLIASQYPTFQTDPPEDIRPLIPLFSRFDLTRADLERACDFEHRFEAVFDKEGNRGEGNWKSGSIYLFIMDDDGNMLFHGADSDFEGQQVVAVDEGGRNVREEILREAETPMNAGIVKYCWDDPTTESDNIDDNDSETAPGDSLKTSYVVDPFVDLGAPGLAGSQGIIFGSGIYPGADPQYPACDGNGMADGGGGMEPMDPEPMDPEPMDPEPMDPEPMDPAMDTSVSGGGCAIAAGSDGTTTSNAFNLLLIVSALLFTVSFGNRAMGRRNRISS